MTIIKKSQKFDVCTDFFGYNKKRELQYRGRLFEMKNLEIVDKKNYLLEAMQTNCKNWKWTKTNSKFRLFNKMEINTN